MKKVVSVRFSVDGFIDGKPYELMEFDKEFHSDYDIDLCFNDLKEVKDLNALDKWVWLLIREYSNDSCDDGFPMYLFHITPKQISDVLGFCELDIKLSLKRLIKRNLVKVYDIEGKEHIYATKHD